MSHFGLKLFSGCLAASLMLFTSTAALAHGDDEHDMADESPAVSRPAAISPDEAAAINVINNRYLRDVKPIVKRTCFNCHSDQTRYPSYYVIPGVKQFIDWDIRSARKHIDMSSDFPFKGHGTPLKDLKAVQKEVEEGDMPPFYYTILHWADRPTPDEVQVIVRWATEGIKLLSSGSPEPAAGQ